MPTFSDDYAAIRAVETRLATVFGTGGTYATKYAGYGGVDVKLKTDEDDEPENVGRPLILLEQESGDRSEWSSARDEYREVAISATTYVSDNSGAQQGTANPVTSDELLSKDLVQEIKANYATWRGLGIEGITIGSQRLNRAQGETVRRITHRISFQYNRA